MQVTVVADTPYVRPVVTPFHPCSDVSVRYRLASLGSQDDLTGIRYDLAAPIVADIDVRSEEHTSELQSQSNLVCRFLLVKNNSVQRVHAPFLLTRLSSYLPLRLHLS